MASLRKRLLKYLLNPYPLRYALARRLIRPDHDRGISDHGRGKYRLCLLEATDLALALGYERVTAVEFGVGAGHGLIALERIAEDIERYYPVNVSVIGFDLGTGLPRPAGPRDMPWHWGEGYFKMDQGELESRLSRAELIIGDVSDTVGQFIASRQELLSRAPLGALLIDLDYCSSTVAALKILDADSTTRLPRMPVYFDDIDNNIPFAGQWLAINEFNDAHESRKLGFRFDRLGDPRTRQILEFHDFDHERYGVTVRTKQTQNPLPPSVPKS